MKSINIWMQLLGFNRDDPDCGAARFLERTGFTPDSVCALLFHSDFVHLHQGMDKEYNLLQNNCAYYGIPRNKERERQQWTNYSLRTLIAELKKHGTDFYAGIMGVYTNDVFHHEWLSDHPELRAFDRKADGGLMCLKRFKDGTYYEDYFAEKLAQTLVDFGCAGAHFSDAFCPTQRLYRADYSVDMTEQFIEHTGIKLPDEVAATMNSDDFDARNIRAEYLWGELREEWIRFWEWRWTRFFKKVCDAAHAVGKKIWILGMYCSDPFETRYTYGFDCAKVMDAGVDCITANILPTSVGLHEPTRPYFFHRIHMDLPMLRAQVKDRNIVTMAGVQDASEEWSVLDHQPIMLERDIYTMSSFRYQNNGDCTGATDGFFLCLGDGLERDSWDFIKKRIDTGFSVDAEHSWSPMILWSDEANEKTLHEYIKTRRTSAHKQSYEIFQKGLNFGGSVRSDGLDNFKGVLFVPNYDMLSDSEKETLKNASYPWVGTVPEGYDISDVAVKYSCTDLCSDYPLTAFICNADVDDEAKAKITALCAEDDGIPSTGDDPEHDVNTLTEVLPFRKLNTGFIKSCGELLRAAMYSIFPVKCDNPFTAFKLKNGKDRLYLYNSYDHHYGHALVNCEQIIASADTVSHYPVLPVRLISEKNTSFHYDYNNIPKDARGFQSKLAPSGVTIVDITRK